MVVVHMLASILGGSLTLAGLWAITGPAWALVLCPLGGSSFVLLVALALVSLEEGGTVWAR